jgi:hypothetical protein
MLEEPNVLLLQLSASITLMLLLVASIISLLRNSHTSDIESRGTNESANDARA